MSQPLQGGSAPALAPRLSLVVPCYSESALVADSVNRLCAFLEANLPGHEVLWVDDGSQDGTSNIIRQQIAQRPDHRLITLPSNRGKGGALMAGLAEARGELIGFCDADLAIELSVLPLLVAALEPGADAAVASKWHPQAHVAYPAWRRLLSRMNARVGAAILQLPFHDTQCGMKLFRAATCRQYLLACQQTGWLWDAEALARLHRAGRKVVEVPAALDQRAQRPSRVFSVRSVLRLLRDYFRLARALRD